MFLTSLLVFVGSVGEAILDDKVPDPLNVGTLMQPVIGLFPNKCIEDLGCFSNGPPFYNPIYRPISLLPADNIQTKFLLYTPRNPDSPNILNTTVDSVKSSDFFPGLPTKILIHGYTVQLREDDVRFVMKDELLKEGLYNVVIANWTEYSKFPYYQAVANARVVGAQVAKFVLTLMAFKGLTAQNVHIIGHSLGGQVSGWAGERIPNLGRITGLDPAGPYFQNAENEVRLDITDADFVDVIHTDGGVNGLDGLGIDESIGHMDFYPNGGKSQPGCFYRFNETNEIKDPVERYIANSCDHARANYYFIDSINRCTFIGYQCESYKNFENGECETEAPMTSAMGFRARKIPGVTESLKFYLNTFVESPFCID